MVRPSFMDSLALKQAVHPILEKFSGTPVTPNDALICPDESFIIITGPNMAGKSTYLKMIAILQAMAQMGSYVPAEMATFRLTDQIFSRITLNDDLEHSLSAFQLEMNDVKYIVDNFSDMSLIIIDELCRSTSNEEGIALCTAISEHFIATKVFVLLSTHFLDLANLDGLYSNVANYHFGSQITDSNVAGSSNLILNHVLQRGPYRGPLYGFEIAALSSMPNEVIVRAKELAAEIRQKRQASSNVDEKKRRRERAVVKLSNKLTQISKYPTMDKEELRTYLKSLQTQYWNEVGESPAVERSDLK